MTSGLTRRQIGVSDFDEERFVQSLEVMPGNRAVVHHVIVYVQPKTLGTLSRTGSAQE